MHMVPVFIRSTGDTYQQGGGSEQLFKALLQIKSDLEYCPAPDFKAQCQNAILDHFF
jgi:hypothetical protein